jgi:hypothetical protein
VTIAIRLFGERGTARLKHDFRISEREIFLREGLDSSGKTRGVFSLARRAEKDTVPKMWSPWPPWATLSLVIPGLAQPTKVVMPGLEPGIHVFLGSSNKDVDGRDKPGHDDGLRM